MNAKVAQGVYHLASTEDEEMGMMFAWTNSYDKSTRFQCAVGAFVNVCSNGMLCGDMANYARKHTGKADHYTIKSTLKGNAHLQFLYDVKTNLFHIGYDSTFIETRLFYLNEESIIEINLGTEKGRINNSFQKEKVFELMHKSQQKVIKKYEQ